MIHFWHRWSDWALTTVSRQRDDGLWQRYESRRCRVCGLPQNRPSAVTFDRCDPPTETVKPGPPWVDVGKSDPAAETVLEFSPEVVLSPPFGGWHPVGEGLEVRVCNFDPVGTLRVRRTSGGRS